MNGVHLVTQETTESNRAKKTESECTKPQPGPACAHRLCAHAAYRPCPARTVHPAARPARPAARPLARKRRAARAVACPPALRAPLRACRLRVRPRPRARTPTALRAAQRPSLLPRPARCALRAMPAPLRLPARPARPAACAPSLLPRSAQRPAPCSMGSSHPGSVPNFFFFSFSL